jgi:hypothetical protein
MAIRACADTFRTGGQRPPLQQAFVGSDFFIDFGGRVAVIDSVVECHYTCNMKKGSKDEERVWGG